MKNIKHDHSLTKCLKGLIFAIMLFMPILIFLPNAFYYGFNETAVAQEKTEQVPIYYDTNEINNYTDFVRGNVYSWNNHNTYTGNGQNQNILLIQNNEVIRNFYAIPIDATDITFYVNGSGKSRIRYTNSNSYVVYIESTDIEPFNFVVDSVLTQVQELLPHFSKCENKYVKGYEPLTTNMSITDSMSYAWDSVWQNDLFSWTDETVIYTGINATTNGIGIPPQSYVASYLTYIFLLTVIYIIVDIILGIFTALTHIFNKEYK